MTHFRRAAAAAFLFIAGSLAPGMPAAAATPEGIVIVGAVAEPQTLDPQAATATNDFRILVNLFEGLVRYRSGTLDIEPALATSWTISPDGLAYRFELRKDVRFQDGTPFDAAAVVFTFDRMLREDHPFHRPGRFPLAFVFSAVSTVNAIDADTVEFRLEEPFAPFLANLATPTGFIVSPAAVTKYGPDVDRNPVGTGPFQFEGWEPHTEVKLARHAGYWAAAPALGGLSFRPIASAAARQEALTSGAIDVMMEPDPGALDAARETSGVTVAEAVAPHLWFLILNTREGALSDKRVRQAVNYAIDKRKIVDEVLKGGAEIAAGPIPAAFGWANDPGVAPYPYDPEKARELIRAAGAEGADLSFYATLGGTGMLDPVPMANAIAADLAAVGLDAKVETYEWNAFLSAVNPGLLGRADMAEMAWTTNDPDTLAFLALRSGAVPAEGGFNSGYYANPVVDGLVEEARRASDRAVRARLYKEIQRIVREDAPWAFIASAKQSAVGGAAVRGLVLEPGFVVDFRPVTKG